MGLCSQVSPRLISSSFTPVLSSLSPSYKDVLFTVSLNPSLLFLPLRSLSATFSTGSCSTTLMAFIYFSLSAVRSLRPRVSCCFIYIVCVLTVVLGKLCRCTYSLREGYILHQSNSLCCQSAQIHILLLLGWNTWGNKYGTMNKTYIEAAQTYVR